MINLQLVPAVRKQSKQIVTERTEAAMVFKSQVKESEMLSIANTGCHKHNQNHMITVIPFKNLTDTEPESLAQALAKIL